MGLNNGRCVVCGKEEAEEKKRREFVLGLGTGREKKREHTASGRALSAKGAAQLRRKRHAHKLATALAYLLRGSFEHLGEGAAAD